MEMDKRPLLQREEKAEAREKRLDPVQALVQAPVSEWEEVE